MSKKQRIEGIVTRNVTLNDDAVMDKDERRIKVSFSSEAKVKRASFFEDPWIEVLGHRNDEVDLSPAWARAFEPPSICNGESASVVLFLMDLDNPNEKIIVGC